MSRRLMEEFQQLELDVQDAKESWRGSLKRGLSKLEKKVFESGPMKNLLEVSSEEFLEETEKPLLVCTLKAGGIKRAPPPLRFFFC